MKRLLLVFFLGIVLTGCGNKTKVLTCTTTKKEENMDVEIKLKAEWDNDTLKAVQLDTFYHLEKGLTNDKKDSFKSYLDHTMSSWNEKSGVKYTSNIENEELKLSLNIDALKGKEALKEFGIVENNSNYDNLKEVLEGQQYSCE